MAYSNSIFKLSLIAFIFSILSLSSYGQEVSTLAGKSNDADGPADQANFASPNGVVVDAQGNLFVADIANHKIRKITPQGIVSTLAGSGFSGYLDGTGSEAMFNTPWGLALDKDGNIFVAEFGGRKVRKVTPEGIVTTVAKSPPVGVQTFYQSTALVVDNTGNIYVADYSWVTKITPDGVVSKLAGSGSGFKDGPGATAKFKEITGITIGADNNLYVVDNGNNRIRKITAQGEVSTYAGSTAGIENGNISVATFSRPYGITIDKEGNMFVSEETSFSIRKISTTGEVSTHAGNGGFGSQDGPAASASFYYPHGIAADSSGNVYVADLSNKKIRKISSEGIVSTVAGVGQANNNAVVDGQGLMARFTMPAGVVTDAMGNVYVAETGRVRKITPAGKVTTLAGSGNMGHSDGIGTNATLGRLTGIALDATGNVFVSDIQYHFIRKITPEGVVSTFAGNYSGYTDGNGIDARFDNPSALAFDAAGNLFVTDQRNYCIRKITPNGDASTFAGIDTAGYKDGNGTNARFGEITGIAIDKDGNIFVADKGNNCIRKISPQGDVTTFAGSRVQGSANGIGIKASFYSPYGICIDASGNLYVTQVGPEVGTESTLIRKITPSAVVTTLAGTGQRGNIDGPSASARFNYPSGIAVDTNYNIYIADQYNNLIRKIFLPNEIQVMHADTNLVSGLAQIDFGTVKIGNSSTAFSFNIENEASALKPVALLGKPIVKVSSNDFIVDLSNTYSPVEVGFPAEFTITFKPSTVGTKTATVTIINNDLNESVYTFEIKGLATPFVDGIESSSYSSVSCYPNPASSRVIIESPAEMLLEVYSSEGNKVIEQMVERGENSVNIEALSRGLYLFNLPSIGHNIKVIKD
ncbi:T9SS type A sorting domain-containing protein [Sporocytophaga myxococcoides]|uniref:T9SS type A sorting domain-containing protein n=1 Tax=Sporocytophaga myxococcoides TaxID=153721 RepID=UPI00040D7099|nr:T9SS type A sorting domain-containing protein [Sporocytophaga myxococcoides]